ncbi:MAG: cytochrome c3 family protein, partial [Rhodospirillaceae bacterium]
KTRRALRELFDTRGVCSTCHYVTREAGEPGWKVAPVRFTKTWMPNSVFSHAAHKIEPCSSCHDVTHSKDAKDIAMPDIATCRRCHVGVKPVRNKIASDCATCHKFHASNEAWDPSLQPRLAHGTAR